MMQCIGINRASRCLNFSGMEFTPRDQDLSRFRVTLYCGEFRARVIAITTLTGVKRVQIDREIPATIQDRAMWDFQLHGREGETRSGLTHVTFFESTRPGRREFVLAEDPPFSVHGIKLNPNSNNSRDITALRDEADSPRVYYTPARNLGVSNGVRTQVELLPYNPDIAVRAVHVMWRVNRQTRWINNPQTLAPYEQLVSLTYDFTATFAREATRITNDHVGTDVTIVIGDRRIVARVTEVTRSGGSARPYGDEIEVRLTTNNEPPQLEGQEVRVEFPRIDRRTVQATMVPNEWRPSWENSFATPQVTPRQPEPKLASKTHRFGASTANLKRGTIRVHSSWIDSEINRTFLGGFAIQSVKRLTGVDYVEIECLSSFFPEENQTWDVDLNKSGRNMFIKIEQEKQREGRLLEI